MISRGSPLRYTVLNLRYCGNCGNYKKHENCLMKGERLLCPECGYKIRKQPHSKLSRREHTIKRY